MSKLKSEAVRRWRVAASWFRGGMPLWRWIVIASAIVVLMWLFAVKVCGYAPADGLRWGGMLLQFAGLWAVVRGLNESRQLFNKPSLWASARQWAGQLLYVFKSSRIVSGTASMTAGAAVVFGAGFASEAAASNSVEDRLHALERANKRIESALVDARRDISNLKNQTSEKLDNERNEREAGDRKIGEQLDKAITGGIALEASGLAYLFVGIWLATVPAETMEIIMIVGRALG